MDVSFAGRALTIRGERGAPEVPADDRIFSGIRYGTFERTILLPEDLDTEHVKAVWRGGILEITIPVSKNLLPKKVPIEVAGA